MKHSKFFILAFLIMLATVLYSSPSPTNQFGKQQTEVLKLAPQFDARIIVSADNVIFAHSIIYVVSDISIPETNFQKNSIDKFFKSYFDTGQNSLKKSYNLSYYHSHYFYIYSKSKLYHTGNKFFHSSLTNIIGYHSWYSKSC